MHVYFSIYVFCIITIYVYTYLPKSSPNIQHKQFSNKVGNSSFLLLFILSFFHSDKISYFP